jgi:hypothetical protein
MPEAYPDAMPTPGKTGAAHDYPPVLWSALSGVAGVLFGRYLYSVEVPDDLPEQLVLWALAGVGLAAVVFAAGGAVWGLFTEARQSLRKRHEGSESRGVVLLYILSAPVGAGLSWAIVGSALFGLPTGVIAGGALWLLGVANPWLGLACCGVLAVLLAVLLQQVLKLFAVPHPVGSVLGGVLVGGDLGFVLWFITSFANPDQGAKQSALALPWYWAAGATIGAFALWYYSLQMRGSKAQAASAAPESPAPPDEGASSA